ncbi:MAG: hypothetical protein NC541_15830 [bacterium]|nr:hypothetical protein [bacterium]
MLCRYTTAKFKGQEIHLAYTVNAMFCINDLLQDGEQIFDLMEEQGQEGFKRFCGAVSILAGCGRQIRESEGLPGAACPEAEELCACMNLVEYLTIRRAAMEAVLLGYGREVVDENEEIDLDLEQLEKKETHQGGDLKHGRAGGFFRIGSAAVRARSGV